jgi:hypothetical protein
LVLANIVVVVFLGGGEIGLGALGTGGALPALASIGVFQVKVLALMLLVLVARRSTQGARAEELMGFWWRRVVPASLGVVGLEIGWLRLQRLPEWKAALEPLALGLFLATTLFIVHRSAVGRSPQAPDRRGSRHQPLALG